MAARFSRIVRTDRATSRSRQGGPGRRAEIHRDSLAIRERRAQADHGNAEWRVISRVSYEKIGVRPGRARRPGRSGWTSTATSSHQKRWPRPIRKRRMASVISRCRTTRSATSRSRQATGPARDILPRRLALASAWPRRFPATPDAREISVSYDKIGDVSRAGKVPGRRREILQRQPRHRRGLAQAIRQHVRMAERSLGIVRQDRRASRDKETGPARV